MSIGLPRANVYGQQTQPLPLPLPPPVVVLPPVIVPPMTPLPARGFLPCTDTTVRTLPQGWRPPAIGPFTFPEPWGTQACRITNVLDLEPVGYAYWRNINAHKDRDEMLVMLDTLSQGPSLYAVDKATLTPSFVRPLYRGGRGEQMYFSALDPDILFVPSGNGLYRYNVQTSTLSLIFSVPSEYYLWQCHSSADERVHSATLRRTSDEAMLGAIVYDEQTGKQSPFLAAGKYDECQVDASGRWLVIKEGDDDNRIIDLQRQAAERVLTNREGAAGHSDVGWDYMIGEDDFDAHPNAIKLWRLSQPRAPVELLYHGVEWTTGVGHVSHTNVQDPRFVVISNATRREGVPRQNEIVQVPIGGGPAFKPLAPSLVDLSVGMRTLSGDALTDWIYRNMPKGNLDAYGEHFVWTANGGENHLDAYVMRVPK